ncbi:MAG: sigma 54-interacting transcriptional regulator [Acidobacteria bacterium]|nr:sigma 54-interacting transcriptional regulator [Acidobacteriota bacterium]
MTPPETLAGGEPADATGDIRQVHGLTEISQALSGTLGLRSALVRVLEILERQQGILRGAVALLSPSGQLQIDAAHGATVDRSGLRYGLHDGVTARVVESGKPVVVPQVSREPMFRDRTSRADLDRRDESFIAVPIQINRKTVGALLVDFPFRRQRDYDHHVRLLKLVATMIALAVRVERLVDAERQRLLEENIHLREELRERYDFSRIVGTSGPMRQVYEQIARVARANTTVLIRGESGTGKELIAHAIHYSSPRAKKPFVKVSCAALPDSLIESELFGYEKGAFTGAQARKKGRFEMADGGTLFLDEIGDVNLSTQVKLLRVLQEREFERLGGTDPVKVNVRLIAATNQDLEKAIAAGTFREDLHYRLNVFTIYVPPLRERKPDILLLVDHFLEKYSIEHGHQIKRISTPAIDMLMSYHWPGNVRELENAIERAVLVCDGNVVHPHHLPPTLQTAEASGTIGDVSLADAVAAYEKTLIQDALKSARGNCSKAAKLLHSTERIISYKVKRLGIDRDRFKG